MGETVMGETVEPDGLIYSSIDRAVLSVVGRDAVSFLHGQLSADIAALEVGGDAPSLLLFPDGKICTPLYVLRLESETLWLVVPTSRADAALSRLARFTLRTSVEISARDDVVVQAVRGEGAAALESDGPGYDPRWPLTEGVDLLVPVDALPAGVRRDDGAYEVLRIRNGVGEMGREFHDDTIPASGGRHFIDSTVSFTKGCYVGQELVARVDSRGANTPTKLRILALQQPVAEGAAVLGAEGTEVGVVTSVGDSFGLAVLRRSVAEGATVAVGTSKPVTATVFDVP